MFFSFDNGKLNQIVDSDYSFDVSYLLPGKPVPATITFDDINKVRQLFAASYGIGGGSGLLQLRPYILGTGEIYTGDNNNPYLNALPTDAELDQLISTGSSKELRNAVVYAVRSKVSCRQIGTFLESLLFKVRARIAAFKADVDGARKLIASIQQQITFLEAQINEANASQLDVKAIQIKIKQV